MILPLTHSRHNHLLKVMSDRDQVNIGGRVLYLTDDAELLKRQLQGEQLSYEPERQLLEQKKSRACDA